MDYGKYSDKYSGRYGNRQRPTKVQRRIDQAAASSREQRRLAVVRAAHSEAKAKAKGHVGKFLDELKAIFRRSA